MRVEVSVGSEWIEVPEVAPGAELPPGRWLVLELRPEGEGKAWRRVPDREGDQ